MRYPIGAMTAGDIIGRGFGLLFSRFPLFYTIMLVMALPILALQLAIPSFMDVRFGFLLLIIPIIVLQTIGTGAMIRVVMQEYLDRPVAFGEAIQFALSRFWALVGTSILAGVLTFVGMLACFLPGIFLAIVFSLASQVVIVEDQAGMAALNRSWNLIRGHFWRVFGILFLVGIIAAIANGAIGGIAAVALPYQELVRMQNTFEFRFVSYPNYAIVTALTTLVQTFFQAYVGICTTLLYFDLRNRKEAFDLEIEADKISAWTERFQPRSQPTSQDIQLPNTGVQQPGAAEPPNTGIRPGSSDLPPSGPKPAP